MEENTDNNFDNVKSMIIKLENPNPIVILTIVATAIVLFYFIYVTTIKISLTDKYYDDNYNIYNITHCKFTDSIVIHGLDNYNSKIVKNNIISITNDNTTTLGVYLNNCIKWTNNKTWYRMLL
jgi:hypothetical protein